MFIEFLRGTLSSSLVFNKVYYMSFSNIGIIGL